MFKQAETAKKNELHQLSPIFTSTGPPKLETKGTFTLQPKSARVRNCSPPYNLIRGGEICGHVTACGTRISLHTYRVRTNFSHSVTRGYMVVWVPTSAGCAALKVFHGVIVISTHLSGLLGCFLARHWSLSANRTACCPQCITSAWLSALKASTASRLQASSSTSRSLHRQPSTSFTTWREKTRGELELCVRLQGPVLQSPSSLIQDW